jgi:hypothetical protein
MIDPSLIETHDRIEIEVECPDGKTTKRSGTVAAPGVVWLDDPLADVGSGGYNRSWGRDELCCPTDVNKEIANTDERRLWKFEVTYTKITAITKSPKNYTSLRNVKVKLGDKVVVYVNKDGSVVNATSQAAVRTIEATVIGCDHISCTCCLLLGVKEKLDLAGWHDTAENTKNLGVRKILNANDYSYSVWTGAHYEVKSVEHMSIPVEPEAKKAEPEVKPVEAPKEEPAKIEQKNDPLATALMTFGLLAGSAIACFAGAGKKSVRIATSDATDMSDTTASDGYGENNETGEMNA